MLSSQDELFLLHSIRPPERIRPSTHKASKAVKVSIQLSIQSYCFNNQLSSGSQVKTSTYTGSFPRRWKRIPVFQGKSH